MTSHVPANLTADNQPTEMIIASDPIGMLIPLCIDYLLSREICDEAGLAVFLQVEEKLVK